MTARIAPMDPPYAEEVKAALEKWMPPGSPMEPLRLFRTLERNHALADRLRGVGALFLGRHALTPPRLRELLILRTCARAGAEYEWGVHVTAFAAAVGLDDAAVRATAARSPGEARLDEGDDAMALRLADELHDDATVSPALWALLSARFGDEQLLEMIGVVGFYHLVSFTIQAAGVEREPWAARFPEARRSADATHRGSCLCGSIEYEVTGELGEFGYCHCTSCRKASGSAHAANAPIDRAAFRVVRGATCVREFESSPGKFRSFCARCGSPLYAYLAATKDVLRLRLGSLDTPFAGRAQAHTFVSDKAPWDAVEGDLPQFPGWAPKSVLEQRGSHQP